MGKLRRALLRGRKARRWLYRDDRLVLPHPDGYDYTEVPAAHLVDEAEFERHLTRLRDKHWIDEDAIQELIEIAQGARS